VPGIAEAGTQEQPLLRIVPGEEGAVSGAQQMTQAGQQDFAELVHRGRRLQAGVDVEQMLPHPALAIGLVLDVAEALQAARQGADFIALGGVRHFDVGIVSPAARRSISRVSPTMGSVT